MICPATKVVKGQECFCSENKRRTQGTKTSKMSNTAHTKLCTWFFKIYSYSQNESDLRTYGIGLNIPTGIILHFFPQWYIFGRKQRGTFCIRKSFLRTKSTQGILNRERAISFSPRIYGRRELECHVLAASSPLFPPSTPLLLLSRERKAHGFLRYCFGNNGLCTHLPGGGKWESCFLLKYLLDMFISLKKLEKYAVSLGFWNKKIVL